MRSNLSALVTIVRAPTLAPFEVLYYLCVNKMKKTDENGQTLRESENMSWRNQMNEIRLSGQLYPSRCPKDSSRKEGENISYLQR